MPKTVVTPDGEELSADTVARLDDMAMGILGQIGAELIQHDMPRPGQVHIFRMLSRYAADMASMMSALPREIPGEETPGG